MPLSYFNSSLRYTFSLRFSNLKAAFFLYFLKFSGFRNSLMSGLGLKGSWWLLLYSDDSPSSFLAMSVFILPICIISHGWRSDSLNLVLALPSLILSKCSLLRAWQLSMLTFSGSSSYWATAGVKLLLLQYCTIFCLDLSKIVRQISWPQMIDSSMHSFSIFLFLLL
jgi:hypothetical protein